MHQPAGRLSRAAWAVVGLLWVVALLNYLDRQLVVTMPGPIKADLGIGDERFGLLSSVFLWVYGFCSPVAGYVADRFGKRPVIIASLLIWSAATFYTGIANSFAEILVGRATLGISEAFYMPAAVSLIVEYHRGATRSRATGLHLSGVYAGSVLGGLGGGMAELFGWRAGFLAFGAIGVAYALVLMIFLPHPADGRVLPRPDEAQQAKQLASLEGGVRDASRDAELPVPSRDEPAERGGLLAGAELAAGILSRRTRRQSDAGRNIRADGFQRRSFRRNADRQQRLGLVVADRTREPARLSRRSASASRRRACSPSARPPTSRSFSRACSSPECRKDFSTPT